MCAFADSVFADYGKYDGVYAALFGPRETWKTTTCVVGGVLDFLIQHPEEAVLIDSHVHKLSKERLSAVKWHMEFNPRYQRYFGNWRKNAKEWNEEEIRLSTREPGAAEPSIATAGTDQSKTGGHYGAIFADDLVNEKNSRTATGRQLIKDHIQTLYPLLKTGGVLFFFGTFWHYDDAYAWLLKLDDEERERAEALGQKQQMPLRRYIKGAFNPDGTLYAPYVLSYEKLEWLRRHMVPSLFAPNYLMVPIEEKDKTFPKSNLSSFQGEYLQDPLGGRFIEFKEGRRVPVLTYFLWDPAGYVGERITQAASSDHGMAIIAVDPDDEWYVLYAEGFKEFASAVVARAVYLTLEFRPTMVKGEWVGSNEQWRTLYLEELRKAGVHLPGIEFVKSVPTTQKVTRIELAIEPRYRRRNIHFKVGLGQVRTQLDEFPKSAKMDILDAIAQGADAPVLRGPGAGDLNKRQIDPDDEDDDQADKNARIIQRAGAWTGVNTPVPSAGFMQSEAAQWPSPNPHELRRALQHLGRGR